MGTRRHFAYDVFVSYPQHNRDAVDNLVAELKLSKPDVRVFLDRQANDLGHSWPQTIFEALDDCQSVVAVFSPPYLLSTVSKNESSIALFRHRESQPGVLFPVYLIGAEQPTYMKLVKYFRLPGE